MPDICDIDFDFFYNVGWGVDKSGKITGYIYPDYFTIKQITDRGISMTWKRNFPLVSDAEQSLKNDFNCNEIIFIEETR
jgi:hypothetical protein